MPVFRVAEFHTVDLHGDLKSNRCAPGRRGNVLSESKQKSLSRRLLIIPPVGLALAALFLVVSRTQPPERVPIEETATTVRFIKVKETAIIPRIKGFGTVQPARVWNAVAQVSGQVIYVHRNFRRGAILDAGTEIIRIDPADYELAIAEAQANIRAAEARLAELKVTEENSRDLLALEKRSLELKEAQLERTQDLQGRGTVSQATLDTEQRDTISQRFRVKDIENTLRLLPTQIEVQEQQIAVNKSKLETAELNLKRTIIRLPFRGRISKVSTEETQFVQAGSVLGSADDIAVSEVEAQFSIAQISGFGRTAAIGPDQDFRVQNIASLARRSGLHAIIRLASSAVPVEWQGKVVRVSDVVGEQTRTVGIVAAVEGSYAQAVPGIRPPLAKGMFVEVELRGRKIPGRIVLPRSAVHQGRTYILRDDERLEIRDVDTGLVQGDVVVVESGLKDGDRVVVSDLIPALPGMLLTPIEDKALAEHVAREASGNAAEPRAANKPAEQSQ